MPSLVRFVRFIVRGRPSGLTLPVICGIVWVGLLASCQFDQRADAKRLEERFAYGKFETGEVTLPYRLLRPSLVVPGRRYPLVVLFHGAGERGTDNEKTMKHFLPLLSRADFPIDDAYVLIPQCAEEYRWVEADWSLPTHRQPTQPSKPMAAVFGLLKALGESSAEAVDASRLYAVGLSMGGFAVWDVLSRRPDLFAAAIAVCGGGDETKARTFQAPVWAFHGAKDQLVRPDRSRNMVKALRKAGKPVRYTEYAEEGHGSWRPAFQDPEVLSWLFAQKR